MAAYLRDVDRGLVPRTDEGDIPLNGFRWIASMTDDKQATCIDELESENEQLRVLLMRWEKLSRSCTSGKGKSASRAPRSHIPTLLRGGKGLSCPAQCPLFLPAQGAADGRGGQVDLVSPLQAAPAGTRSCPAKPACLQASHQCLQPLWVYG